MNEKAPPSRPALRKAVDASVHPALAGRSVVGARSVATVGAAEQKSAPSKAGASTNRSASGKPKPLGKAKRAPTSDVLRPTKSDPAVKLALTVPKSVRKRLRAMAKQRGVEVEVLTATLIVERLQQL